MRRVLKSPTSFPFEMNGEIQFSRKMDYRLRCDRSPPKVGDVITVDLTIVSFHHFKELLVVQIIGPGSLLIRIVHPAFQIDPFDDWYHDFSGGYRKHTSCKKGPHLEFVFGLHYQRTAPLNVTRRLREE